MAGRGGFGMGGGGGGMGGGGGRGMGGGGGGGMGGGGGRGMGGGGGRGMGGGGGRGMGQGMGGVLPPDFAQQYSVVPDNGFAPMNREQEIADLKRQSELLQSQSNQINARIQQLQQGTAASDLVALVAAGRCTGCGRCVPVCPQRAISMDGAVARIELDVCTGCGLCVSACPQKAITLASR